MQPGAGTALGQGPGAAWASAASVGLWPALPSEVPQAGTRWTGAAMVRPRPGPAAEDRAPSIPDALR